jgi:trans-2-enoyl-CoA reductase
MCEITAKRLVFDDFGEPLKVLRLETTRISTSLQPGEILVRWLASPINPFDIYLINGLYWQTGPRGGVAGYEGCGHVEAVGSDITDFKVGDHVVSCANPAIGSWCTHGVYTKEQLFPIDASLPTLTAATIFVNPPTAYRLLKDHVELRKDDWVVQNGANSACGRLIIQMCRLWGYKTINIIRSRPNVQSVKDELTGLGANKVYTEEEFEKALPTIKGVRLALDCVAGKHTAILASCLENGGHLAMYGHMSGQAAELNPSDMISKHLNVHGFTLSKWLIESDQKAKTELYNELCELFKSKQLIDPPYVQHSIEQFAEAITASQSSPNAKHIFVL